MMDQRLNSQVYVNVALALVEKWESARGKEKISDLCGIPTNDLWIWSSVALPTELGGQREQVVGD